MKVCANYNALVLWCAARKWLMVNCKWLMTRNAQARKPLDFGLIGGNCLFDKISFATHSRSHSLKEENSLRSNSSSFKRSLRAMGPRQTSPVVSEASYLQTARVLRHPNRHIFKLSHQHISTSAHYCYTCAQRTFTINH